MRNLGLGPAIIKDRYFEKDGVRFVQPSNAGNEVKLFVDSIFAKKIPYDLLKFGLPSRESAIAAQGEVVVVDIEFTSVPAGGLATIEAMAGSISFFVNYESLYAEAFSLKALSD